MQHSVKEIFLDNGISGLLIDVPQSKVFNCSLIIKAGFFACPDDKPELAHFLEHMVFKANSIHKEEEEFDAAMIENGAFNNAYTDSKDIQYIIKSADFEWQRVLKLMLVAITEPLLLEKHFITEREVIREELTNYLNEYWRVLATKLDYKLHGYDFTPATCVDKLDNIKPADIISFHQKTHFNKNLQFVITAADIDKKEDEIKDIFSNLEFKNSRPDENFQNRFDFLFNRCQKPIVVVEPAVKKLFFDLGFAYRGRLSIEQQACIWLLTDLLTGRGSASLINKKARGQGLNYGVRSYYSELENFFIFGLYSEVRPANASKLFNIIVSEMKSVMAGKVSQKEFKATQKTLVGRIHRIELVSNNLFSHYSRTYPHLNRIKNFNQVRQALKDVNKEQMVETFKLVLSQKNFHLGLLGQKADDWGQKLYDLSSTIF